MEDKIVSVETAEFALKGLIETKPVEFDTFKTNNRP